MIKLDTIIEYWKIDSKIDESKPHQELVNTPLLHAKYVEILSQHRLAAQKAKFDHARMKKVRREYYLGNLAKETLDEYGWDQFDLKIGTKGNIETYLEADDFLIKILEKKAYYEECCYVCEAIIKELGNRTWQLREYMTYTRFLAGN
jgi:hypothetical protein